MRTLIATFLDHFLLVNCVYLLAFCTTYVIQNSATISRINMIGWPSKNTMFRCVRWLSLDNERRTRTGKYKLWSIDIKQYRNHQKARWRSIRMSSLSKKSSIRHTMLVRAPVLSTYACIPLCIRNLFRHLYDSVSRPSLDDTLRTWSRSHHPCSNEIWWCRHCHNHAKYQQEPDWEKKHELDRKSIREVICALCDLRQPVGTLCLGCGVSFGAYSCTECPFYDDDLTKQTYHCHECGICRVGGRENYFHCSTCGSCYGINLQVWDHWVVPLIITTTFPSTTPVCCCQNVCQLSNFVALYIAEQPRVCWKSNASKLSSLFWIPVWKRRPNHCTAMWAYHSLTMLTSTLPGVYVRTFFSYVFV